MGMDLELEWEEPGWQRMMDSPVSYTHLTLPTT